MIRRIIDGEMRDGTLNIEYEDGGFAMLQVQKIIDERDALLRERDELRAERDQLNNFADDLLEAAGWSDGFPGYIDSGDFQDIAVKHGVLVETKPDKPCIEEGCACAELFDADDFAAGDVICYRRNPAALQPTQEPTK